LEKQLQREKQYKEDLAFRLEVSKHKIKAEKEFKRAMHKQSVVARPEDIE